MSEATIPSLVRQAQHALALHQAVVLRVVSNFDLDTEPNDVPRTLYMLFQYFLDRGRAVLTLLENRLDWDAEILLGTCYECASQILFIALSPPSEQARLVWEFWVPLGASADRKTARKAGFAERLFSETAQDERDVFRLLRDPRMIRDSPELTKAARRRLEHRWSFSELIETLSDLQLGDRTLTDARSLLHTYGMASHLAHADCNALDLMTDRALRGSDELSRLRDGHAARITIDLVSIGTFCAHAMCKCLAPPNEELRHLWRQVEVVLTITEEITRPFYASQRGFYDSMLRSPHGSVSPEVVEPPETDAAGH